MYSPCHGWYMVGMFPLPGCNRHQQYYETFLGLGIRVSWWWLASWEGGHTTQYIYIYIYSFIITYIDIYILNIYIYYTVYVLIYIYIYKYNYLLNPKQKGPSNSPGALFHLFTGYRTSVICRWIRIPVAGFVVLRMVVKLEGRRV